MSDSSNELPSVYELHVNKLLKFIVKSIRCEHQYETFNSLLVPRCVGYKLRSAKRNEVCVPFRKQGSSTIHFEDEYPNKLIKTSILVQSDEICSFDDKNFIRYCHEFFRNIVLGNQDIDFVYGKQKLV